MKTPFIGILFFALAVGINSCKKEDPLYLAPVNIGSTDGTDDEGVQIMTDKTVDVIVRHTLLDTTYANNWTGFSIYVKTPTDDSLTFDWYFDSKKIQSPKYFKLWKSENWMKGSGITVDVSKLSGTIPLSVDIKNVKDGKVRKRSAKVILKQHFEVYDILRFTYGMSRSSVMDTLRNTYKLTSMDINDFSPSYINAVLKGFGGWDYGLQFYFVDNKLTSISEFGHNIGTSGESSPTVFNSLLQKFGAKDTFKETYNAATKKTEILPALPYSWVFSGIRFTVDYKEFDVTLSKKIKFRAITYEKVK